MYEDPTVLVLRALRQSSGLALPLTAPFAKCFGDVRLRARVVRIGKHEQRAHPTKDVLNRKKNTPKRRCRFWPNTRHITLTTTGPR